jgi:hypothetical protein
MRNDLRTVGSVNGIAQCLARGPVRGGCGTHPSDSARIKNLTCMIMAPLACEDSLPSNYCRKRDKDRSPPRAENWL